MRGSMEEVTGNKSIHTSLLTDVQLNYVPFKHPCNLWGGCWFYLILFFALFAVYLIFENAFSYQLEN